MAKAFWEATRIKDLTSDELKGYMEVHREDEYNLIDVREPREYAQGHIPGANLIPLKEIEYRLAELDLDRDLIFYCRSGRRSRVAATFVADSGITTKAIYNLDKGILGWEGKSLPNLPRVRTFEEVKGFKEILLKAIDLEKGAFRFYQACIENFADTPFFPIAQVLSKLEVSHAMAIYRLLESAGGAGELEPFEDLFEGMPGDVLEGGISLDNALRLIPHIEGDISLNLAEIALEIEYRAYDLYRNLSHQATNPEEEQAFLILSEQEKAHIRVIAGQMS